MNLVALGIIWFTLYVLLVLAPSALALASSPFPGARPFLLEVSVGLGLLAAPMMLTQLALVSRTRVTSRPFGTDALVQFHRYMGTLAAVFAIIHVLLLNFRGLPWSTWSPFTGSLTTRAGAIVSCSILLLFITTVFRERLRLSFEWWRTLHVLLAILAIAALVLHIVRVSGYSGTPAMRWLLGAYLVAAVLTLLRYRVVRPLLLTGRPWAITENIVEGSSTRTLRVRPVDHGGFSFEPGQFGWLITGRSPFSRQQHPISFASSAERESTSDIEVTIRDLGDWSGTTVPGLAPGAIVWLDGPYGAFTTEGKPAQGFVFFAGGIGITPIRSMLLTMRDRGDRRHAVLLYATRDTESASFMEELHALQADLELDVVQVLETAPSGWNGETGWITDDTLERHLPPFFRRYHYFICGPVGMMNAVEAALLSRGVPAGAIHSERFDMV